MMQLICQMKIQFKPLKSSLDINSEREKNKYRHKYLRFRISFLSDLFDFLFVILFSK